MIFEVAKKVITQAEYAEMLRRTTTTEDAAEQIKAATERAGVPIRFQAVPPSKELPKELQAGGGVYIQGRVGVGKTWTACAMLRGWLEQNPTRSARFVSSIALLTAIRSTFDGAGSEGGILAEYQTAGLLVIDDLGKEVPTSWALSKVFELVDSRWANVRPTIITTQFAPSKLAARFAERGDLETAQAIVSRLVDNAKPIKINGRDRRTDG